MKEVQITIVVGCRNIEHSVKVKAEVNDTISDLLQKAFKDEDHYYYIKNIKEI